MKSTKTILLLLVVVSVFILKVHAQPSISSYTPQSGAIGTIVTITGANLNNPTALNIGGIAALPISSSGTSIVAMVMPGASTGAVSVTTASGTANGANNFIITAAVNPTTQVGNKLTASGPTDSITGVGEKVAISADGNTAVVRSSLGVFGGVKARVPVFVFTKTNGLWSQQGGSIQLSDGANNEGGIALSADGNTLIIGSSLGIGGAFVFTRSNGIWTQQGAKLIGTGNIGASRQGYDVSLSADGNTAVMGGYGDDGTKGAVWVFTRTNGIWTQQGNKLVGTGANGLHQAEKVVISADGNTLLFNGPEDDAFKGTVWVFTRTNGVWSQQGNKLTGSSVIAGNIFGYSLSVSADGNTALMGSDGAGAWVFTRSAGIWSQQTKLTTPASTSGFGTAVSINSDGNLAVVGAPYDNTDQGAVFVFARNGSTWSQQGNKLVGSGNVGAANQGISVALTADGSTFISGATADNNNTGAAWIFTQISAPTITSFSPANGSVGSLVTITGTNLNNATSINIGGVAAIPISNSGTSLVAMVMPGATTGTVSVTTTGGTANGTGNFTINAKTFPNAQQGNKLIGTGAIGTGSEQGKSVTLSADGNTAVVSGYADDGLKGAVWVYNRTGTVWSQTGTKLTATGATGNAGFGSSVSLSADGNTILIGGTFDNGNMGAVWVFTRSGGVWSQQGNKLVGTGTTGTTVFQGGAVSLSADGNTAVSGGYGDNNNQGAIWVFKRTGTAWAQQGTKLTASGVGSFPRVGYSVALSADGNTIITGGYSDNNQGAVWVFTQIFGAWSQQGNKITATGNTGNAALGISVAINADGNTAAVGGYGDDGNKGAVWIFTRTAGAWSQQGNKLSGSNKVGNAIEGTSIAISADGNTVIAGAPVDNANTGTAWVYGRTAGVWSQQGNKLIGTGNVGVNPLGAAVAISADGNTAIVGGKSDNSEGAAWVFVKSSEVKTSSATVTACTSYDWNGVTYTTSGTYTKTFTGGSSIGTDSIATLNLTINQPSTSTTTAAARNGFTWNGVLYKKSGTYTKTFAGGNAKGCDSVATLNLTIVDTSATTVINCGNYTWNGTTYTNSGTYTRTFTGGSAQGNDSIATLNLTINQPSTSTTTAAARNGFTWNGVLYKKSGTYTRTFAGGNAKGCDSIATLNITIVDTSATTVVNCGNYSWNGTTYTNSGTYTRTFTGGSAQGNDSIATLNLTINTSTSSSVSLTACDSLLWNGTVYKSSGVYTRTFIGANSKGCDSVVTLNLTVNRSSSSTTTINISNGGSYLFNNVTYRTAGTYQTRLQNSRGCDSIATLVLTTNSVTFNSTIVNNPCINSSAGSIAIAATGGFGVLTYALNTGSYQSSPIFSSLVSGSYTVNVKDAQGIVVSKTETVISLSNTPIVPVLTAQNVSCFGGNNGSITIGAITGGVAPYTTVWTPTNSTANAITNLTIGNYSVRITDAFGCSVTAQQTVTQPTQLVVSAVTTNPLCNNQCNGSIQASTVGGTGAVSFAWSNSATTSLISNLCAGNYTVTARDANGCTNSNTYTVTNPTLFSLKLDSVYTICANQNYKTDITNTGFPGASYSWTSSVGFTATTPAITLVRPGFYYARAVSANNCVALDTLDLRASKDSIKSEFQVASNVFVGDTVKFVNINQPFPDSSIWSLPTGTSYNIVSQRPVLLELKFNAVGQYAVGLRTVRGACQSVSTKTISVLQPTGISNPGSTVLSYYIEKFGISPNPNKGSFTVNISLSQPSAIRLRLINTITGAVVNDRSIASAKSFTIPYNLTLINGTYVMVLETSFAPGFFQMIVQ